MFHDISKQVLATYHGIFTEGHIALPALPSLPTSQDIILWHWVGDNGNWYPYDPRQNEGIRILIAVYHHRDHRIPYGLLLLSPLFYNWIIVSIVVITFCHTEP